MKFVVSGEWSRNRLLRTIVVLYCIYVAALWVTNGLLYFHDMGLDPASVVAHYLGDAQSYRAPRTYRGLLEISHYHLFAVGMLLMVLTHLMLFVPLPGRVKAWLIATPFASAFVDEGAGWLVRFVSPDFAALKIAGFLMLQLSLLAMIVLSLWACFSGSQANYSGIAEPEDELD